MINLSASVEKLSTLHQVKELSPSSHQAGGSELSVETPLKRRVRKGTVEVSSINRHNISITFDLSTFLGTSLLALGLCLSPAWEQNLRCFLVDISYNQYTHNLYLDSENSLLSDVRRKVKVIVPMVAYQVQTSSLPRSITWYPLIPCQSPIFDLCTEGNIDAVRLWFEKSRSNPFVVNQHGENLLHVSQ